MLIAAQRALEESFPANTVRDGRCISAAVAFLARALWGRWQAVLGGEARLDPTIGGESIEAMRSPAVLKKEKKKKKASGEEGGRTSAAVRWKAGRRGADGAGVQRGARGAGEAHAATGRVGCRRH